MEVNLAEATRIIQVFYHYLKSYKTWRIFQYKKLMVFIKKENEVYSCKLTIRWQHNFQYIPTSLQVQLHGVQPRLCVTIQSGSSRKPCSFALARGLPIREVEILEKGFKEKVVTDSKFFPTGHQMKFIPTRTEWRFQIPLLFKSIWKHTSGPDNELRRSCFLRCAYPIHESQILGNKTRDRCNQKGKVVEYEDMFLKCSRKSLIPVSRPFREFPLDSPLSLNIVVWKVTSVSFLFHTTYQNSAPSLSEYAVGSRITHLSLVLA